MAVRMWTALLLLGAVVFMHGLQCASADHNGATPLLSAVAAGHGADAHMTAAAAAAVASAMPAAEHTADSPAPGQTAGAVVAGTVAQSQSDTSPHSGAGHLWSVCLAVLAAGLAMLLVVAAAALVRRSAPALLTHLARVTGAPALLRPPDLSALCVLRI